MLEFTVSTAALQSTFGFFHPQTLVLIRGGFPLLSRGGQAQQLAFCRDLKGDVAELSLQVGSVGGCGPGVLYVCPGAARGICIPLEQL